MNPSPDKDRLDDLLADAFEAQPPPFDFRKWQQRYPEAVGAFKSACCEPAKAGSDRPFLLRIGAWIMSNKYARFATGTGAIALVVALAAWLYGNNKAGNGVEQGTGSIEVSGVEPRGEQPAAEHNVRQLPAPGAWRPGAAIGLGAKTLLERLRISAAVVRARIVKVQPRNSPNAEAQLTCEPIRVLYGRVPPGALLYSTRWGPYDEDWVGREVIMYLMGCHKTPEGVVCHCFSVTHYPPRGSRYDEHDRIEKKIVEALETGAHLTLTPGRVNPEFLTTFLRESERVVRAKLTKTAGESSVWEVEEFLGIVRGMGVSRRDLSARTTGEESAADQAEAGLEKDAPPPPVPPGKDTRAAAESALKAAPPPTEPPVQPPSPGEPLRPGPPFAVKPPKEEQPGDQIEVGLDLWRKRAESLVRYWANKNEQQTATEGEIQKEFDRLVKAELKVGCEAVLFLQPGTDAKGKAMYRLVGIAPADPRNEQAFDHFVPVVREAIKKGVWGHIDL